MKATTNMERSMAWASLYVRMAELIWGNTKMAPEMGLGGIIGLRANTMLEVLKRECTDMENSFSRLVSVSKDGKKMETRTELDWKFW